MAQEASRAWNAGGPVTEQQLKMQEDRSRGGQIGGPIGGKLTTSTHALSFFTSCLPAGFQLARSLIISLVSRPNITHPRQPTTTALSDASPNSLTHCHSAIIADNPHPSSLLQGVASREYDMLPMGLIYDRGSDRIFLDTPRDFPSGFNTRWLASHNRGDIVRTAIAAISDYNTMVESEAGTAWLKRAGWKAFPVPSHEDLHKRVEPSLSTDAWGRQKPASIFNYMNGLHDVYNIIDSTAPLSFGGTTGTLPTQAKLSKKRKMPPKCGEPNQAGPAAPPPAPAGLSPRVPAGMPVDSRAKDELLAAAVAAAAARHSQAVQQVVAARAQLLIMLLQQQQGGSGATEDVSRRR